MADVAASANDPIFLNHHAMVDCIFETWLKMNPNAQYPADNKIPQGHGYDDYIVPFFPLYKHSDMFTTADKFGYQCIIKLSKSVPRWKIILGSTIGSIVGIIILCALIGVPLGCYIQHHRNKAPYTPTQNRDYGTSNDGASSEVLIRK